MDESFFSYLQRLELMAFFSGFPLVYALVFFIAGNKEDRTGFKKRIVNLLPVSYALTGTLYLGLQLKNLYPDYSFENIKMAIENPGLTIWALLSLLFWLPVVARKPVLALLHSAVFFFFLVKDLLLKELGRTDRSILKNDMNIYTISILLNIVCLLVVLGLSYLVIRKKPLNS